MMMKMIDYIEISVEYLFSIFIEESRNAVDVVFSPHFVARERQWKTV